jgi:phosphoribosylanthranilate isomerase
MENWIEFARKAGLKVTIEEIDIQDLSEDLQQCKQMISQYNTIGVFEPIEDEEFNQWVNETKQDFIKMIQDLPREKIERKQETKILEKNFY